MKKFVKTRAFTLLELMIVLAVIAVLGTIAVPYYKQSLTKAKITELLTVADSYKLKILAGELEQELVVNNPSNYVAKLAYQRRGEAQRLIVTADMAKIGMTQIGDHPLELFFVSQEGPQQIISWQCRSTPGYTEVVPNACREPVDQAMFS